MKTIAIFSDTHGNRTELKKAHGIMRDSDLIIHAGDGTTDMMVFPEFMNKIHAVSGNCDGNFCLDRELVLQVEDCNIFVTHGDLYGVKSGLQVLANRASALGCNVCIYGHNHTKNVQTINDVLMINPGTLSRYATTKSMCFLVIDGKKAVATINEKIFNLPN